MKGDDGELWGTGLCDFSDKMLGNWGGGMYFRIQSAVSH